jgi:hypothetical protein
MTLWRWSTSLVLAVALIFPAGQLAARSKPACAQFSKDAVPRAMGIQQITCQWVSRRLMIIGELHGTNEIPALLTGLIAAQPKTRAIQIGLEWSVEQQAAVDRYLRSAGTAADLAKLTVGPYWEHPDGRMSHAWLAVLDKVRELRLHGRQIDVFMMEPNYGDPASIKAAGGYIAVKEAGISRAIQNVLSTAPHATLVAALMGNFHTRLDKDSPNLDSSVTFRLRADEPLVLLPYAWQQTAWACTTDGCGPHSFNSSKTGVAAGMIGIEPLPDAPSGVLAEKVQLHVLTASAPARDMSTH